MWWCSFESYYNKKGFTLLRNSFSWHDFSLPLQMGSTYKKYWNVAIFKLRLLNDQHADCEYTQFRGKMTQAPMVVRQNKIHCNFFNVTYFVVENLMSKSGIPNVYLTHLDHASTLILCPLCNFYFVSSNYYKLLF